MCGISKPVVLAGVFSIAGTRPLLLSCSLRRLLLGPGAQPAVSQSRDTFQLAIDGPAELERIQALAQLRELRQLLRVRLRTTLHALERRACRVVHAPHFRAHAHFLQQLHRRNVVVSSGCDSDVTENFTD